ncbi:MAG: YbjN domain-containing protein [Cyanothece sp. SIO1E1]|nr:YbjN domain-containing protein [Cyanothece sp. SIO1E1]
MTQNSPGVETLSSQDDGSIEEPVTASHMDVIETVISSLAQDQTAMVSRTEAGHLWKFKYGSVEVFVQLTGLTDEDNLTVWSAVLKLPAKNEPQLMRQLLEMNWSATFEARFGILEDQIVVVSSRMLAGLNPSEVSRIITVVASIADQNDDVLIEQFGS